MLEKLQIDLAAAMKARDAARTAVLRHVLAQLKNALIDKGEALTEAEVLEVLKRGVKTRRESEKMYRQGNRIDLANAEAQEIEVLASYLPAQVTGAALEALVDQAIAQLGAQSLKDMGAVMQAVLKEHGQTVDGQAVQVLVKTKLAASG